MTTTSIKNLDGHGNWIRREGCDFCFCGCKYWERDHCVDCGATRANHEIDSDDEIAQALANWRDWERANKRHPDAAIVRAEITDLALEQGRRERDGR